MSLTNVNSIILPLHSGHPPHYLIRRMIKLSGAISKVLIDEYGTKEFLKRISDPLWFQALGCVLGFDWHSSGLTTVLIGVLKQSLSADTHGIAIAGGKGSRAKNTLNEIRIKGCNDFNFSEKSIQDLVYYSRMTAKVDNSAIQDNYFLYHHSILFDCDGNWSIIQQGLNNSNATARRYHWFSKYLKRGKFTLEPHTGIIGDRLYSDPVLNMTSHDSIENQKITVDLINDNQNFEILLLSANQLLSKRKETSLDRWIGNDSTLPKSLEEKWSFITSRGSCDGKVGSHYSMPKTLDWSVLKRAYDIKPSNYEEFLSIKGVGPSTVRALSLIGELIFGTMPSWQDPAKYCFAHGGKDGVPYFIDRKSYDESIKFLDASIQSAEISTGDRVELLKKLSKYNLRIYSQLKNK